MPDLLEDDSSRPNEAESGRTLRFVPARPNSKQARRETTAAIRAHASRASWAKIKQKAKKTTPQSSRSSSRDQPSQPPGVKLVSPASNDRPNNDHTAGIRPTSSRQVMLSRATTRQSILGSIGVPHPLRAVGAGELDPFASYPSNMPKEIAFPILSKANNFLNMVFPPDPNHQEDGIARQWMSRSMKNSLLFHVFCFAQLARLATPDWERLNPVNRKAYWYCHTETVQEVNRRFNESSTTQLSDETILAIMGLAFSGNPTTGETDYSRSPSQGPMNSMQGLDVYAGQLNSVTMHVNGLTRMLSMRGGIGDIEFPGLQAMLSYGDLILASRSLRKPGVPFVPLANLPELTLAAVSRAAHPLAGLGSGFQILDELLPAEHAQTLVTVLQNLSTYLISVDNYIMGRSQAQSLGVLADQRNFVQHRLLSMLFAAPENATCDSLDDMASLSRACLTAAVIYSMIAVFPVPRPHTPFPRLARQLKQHLVNYSDQFERKWQGLTPILLWMTFLGALASTAYQESEQDKIWYIGVLERLLYRMQIFSWQSLREQLMTFLWYPITSDADGRELWRAVHVSNPFA